MQEIIEAFSQAGILPPPRIELDGKLKRWAADDRDKKKSAWMVGFNNVTTSGQNFSVVVGGSLKTGEEVKYQSNGVKLDKHDKARINEQMRKAQEIYEASKQKAQEEAAIEAKQIWEEASRGPCPNKYSESKRIGQSDAEYRYAEGIGGKRLLIPMSDRDGKLWGIQTITEDGSKFFMSGQRVSATFHTIGANVKESQELYICEGFATGVTIHEALKKTVIVAFNSGNLRAVAQALFEKYPDKAYVICGDDDKWTVINDIPKNPGRIAATEAADACVGKAVFPIFGNEETKPSDFNDLMCLEGIDAVKAIFAEVKPEAHFIIPLGYNEKKYYVFSNENLQIQEMTPAELCSQAGLCRIQPTHYWENLYPGQRGGTRWGDAGADIMSECHAKGIFKTDYIRGPGAWMDENRPVFHCGDSLFFNGKYHDLNKSLKSKFMYEYSDARARMDAEPLSDADAEAFVEALENASWKREESGPILAAWLALAPISGALDWRPHIWLTGPAGTGKSWLMEHVCSQILRGYATFAQGQTTEAGLRQNQKSNSLPIIFDEFETNDEHSSQRVRMVLELARQASSDSSAVVYKGSTTGDAMEFRPRFSMLVSSVRVNLVHEEDSSRFTLLEIERKGSQADFLQLENWAITKPKDFGSKLARRSFDLLPVIVKNSRTFQKIIGKRYSMRFGQQWGTIAAGLASLAFGSRVFHMDDGDKWITQLEEKGFFASSAPVQEDQDELRCLDYLLHSSVEIIDFRDDKIKMPVLEVIGKLKEHAGYAEQLERYGIKADEGFFYVIQNFDPVRKIYSNTKWAGGYAKSLVRLQNAKANHSTRFKIFSKVYKCVKIPRPISIE